MIGLLADPSELEIAGEFFQLFKTPWEPYRKGHRYDIVLSTDGRLPDCVPQLLLVYGSNPNVLDHELDIPRDRLISPVAEYAGSLLPIYGYALAFDPVDAERSILSAGDRIIASLRMTDRGSTVRIGYDLFQETKHVLSRGQPTGHARSPTVELHIALLRDEILRAGLPLLEIPPMPAGYPYIACLTHDIDFVGIRPHLLDHTMWGFLYRATIGAAVRWLHGGTTAGRMLRSWCAALQLPFVYLGLARDYWLPFEWYLRVERGIPTTYFLIPYRDRAGDKVESERRAWRAAKYDVTEILGWTAKILAAGGEIGVHGIDAWHSATAARDERQRVAGAIARPVRGIRMHWLLQDGDSYRVLDEAGLEYDSTAGYNDAIGYRCGTSQVFRPPGVPRLLELPLHIQDGALFFPDKLGLTEELAWHECERMIRQVQRAGGVLTVLWHDRSHGPERFWGDFYVRLLNRLRESGACFANASQTVEWFRRRREVRFNEIDSEDGSMHTTIETSGPPIVPPLRLRMHGPTTSDSEKHASNAPRDEAWSGDHTLYFDPSSCRLVRRGT